MDSFDEEKSGRDVAMPKRTLTLPPSNAPSSSRDRALERTHSISLLTGPARVDARDRLPRVYTSLRSESLEIIAS